MNKEEKARKAKLRKEKRDQKKKELKSPNSEDIISIDMDEEKTEKTELEVNSNFKLSPNVIEDNLKDEEVSVLNKNVQNAEKTELEIKTNEEIPETELPIKISTFNEKKAEIRRRLKEDIKLKTLRLTAVDVGESLIIYQGAPSNQVAIFYENGNSRVYRTILRNKFKDLI